MTTLWLRDLRPRIVGIVAVVTSIFVFTLIAMWMSQSMDKGIYEALPEAMLTMTGVPSGASIEVMAYSQMTAFLGALTAAGYAVAVGTGVVAGQERARLLQVTLAQPLSRSRVAATKAVTLVVVVAVISAGLWATSLLAAAPFDIRLGDSHLVALAVALGANALFCGAVAFAIGAATGNPSLAGNVASVVVVVGWLLAGLLSSWSKTADFVDYIPWSWYSKPQVLVNGLDGGRLALLLGGSAVLIAVGIACFVRRDLTTVAPRSLADRLAALMPTRSGVSRKNGRTPSLLGLTLSRRGGLLVTVASIMSGMGILLGPMYEQMAPQVASLSTTMPKEIFEMWGAGDMSTPAGFYWGEMFGLLGPAAVIALGVAVAAGMGADEQERRLRSVLAVTTRARLAAVHVGAQVALVVGAAAVTGLALWCGAALGKLNLPAGNILGASVHLAALGLFVSATALLAAAVAGSSSAATWTGVGVAVIGYGIDVAVKMVSKYADWGVVSPFHWYGSSQPLANGADWAHVAVLVAGAVAFWAAAFPLFQRRDLTA